MSWNLRQRQKIVLFFINNFPTNFLKSITFLHQMGVFGWTFHHTDSSHTWFKMVLKVWYKWWPLYLQENIIKNENVKTSLFIVCTTALLTNIYFIAPVLMVSAVGNCG